MWNKNHIPPLRVYASSVFAIKSWIISFSIFLNLLFFWQRWISADRVVLCFVQSLGKCRNRRSGWCFSSGKISTQSTDRDGVHLCKCPLMSLPSHLCFHVDALPFPVLSSHSLSFCSLLFIFCFPIHFYILNLKKRTINRNKTLELVINLLWQAT